MHLLLAVAAAFLMASAAISQPAGLTHHLPGTIVYDVIQDDEGTIWMGTDIGLVAFDGYSYTTYTTSEGLPSNEVLFLMQDDERRIWTMNFSGATAWIRDGKIESPATNSTLQSVSDATPHTAIQVHDDTIWIATEEAMLYRLAPGQSKAISLDQLGYGPALYIALTAESKPLLIFSRNVVLYDDGTDSFTTLTEGNFTKGRLFTEDDGRIFAPSADGFRQVYPAAPAPEAEPLRMASGRPSIRLTALVRTYDNKLVFGGSRGLFAEIDRGQNRYKTLIDGVEITSLIEDDEGNIWASTLGRGVYMVPAGFWNAVRISSAGFGTASFKMAGFLDKQRVIIGSSSDNFLIAGEGRVEEQQITFGSRNEPRQQTNALSRWGDLLLMGTQSDVVVLDAQEGIALRELVSFPLSVPKRFSIINSDSAVVSSVESANLLIRDTSAPGGIRMEKLHPGRSTAIAWSSRYGLLFGNSRGMFRIENGEAVHFSNQLTGVNVTMIVPVGGGFYIGTNGKGLWYYENDSLERLHPDENRIRTVRDLVAGEDGTLWIATPQGVWQIPKESGRLQLFDSGNILSVDLFGEQLVYSTSQQVIIRPVMASPLPFKQLRLRNPLVVVDEMPFDPANLYRIPHQARSLSVKSVASYYRNPQELAYRYRLSPVDTDWYVSAVPEVQFRGLPPGSYTLHIEAFTFHDENQVSEAIILPLTILPPFWKTMWFHAVVVLLLIGFLAGGIKWRIRTVEAKERERYRQLQKTVELEHQALSAMMNPHFIFNVLNSIRYFLYEKSAEEADDFLVKFASLIRMQLESSFRKTISLKEELEHLTIYAQLESMRFQEEVTFEVNLSDEVEAEWEEIQVPAILLQPFVENAIWHGIQPKETGGAITVGIRFISDTLLEIVIDDDGVGMADKADLLTDESGEATIRKHQPQKDKKSSLAMELIRRRLELMSQESGEEASLEIKSRTEGGTRVRLVIPAA